MDRVIVYIRERKLYIIILVAFLFVIFSAQTFFSSQNPAFDINPTLVQIASVATFAFFAFILFICIRVAIKGREGFLAGPKGVYDKSSALSLGFIPWEDISYLCVKKIDKRDFLLIFLKDVDKYKKSENDFIARVIDANMHTYNTPVAIDSKNLKCDIFALEKSLLQMYERNNTQENKDA